jgi:hypothetical protein
MKYLLIKASVFHFSNIRFENVDSYVFLEDHFNLIKLNRYLYQCCAGLVRIEKK